MTCNSRLTDEFAVIAKRCFWAVACFVVALPVFAAGSSVASSVNVNGLDAQSMVNKLATQIPNLMRLVTASAYVLGMYFIIQSLMKFKEAGEARTQMSQQHHMKEPLTYMAVGVFLLYLPSAVSSGMSTFWSEPAPYGYLNQTGQYWSFWSNCLMIVQLFGTIAFIRGLIILSHTGGHHGQQGSVAKGMTHIVGGIFCINIYQFIQMVFATLGVNLSVS